MTSMPVIDNTMLLANVLSQANKSQQTSPEVGFASLLQSRQETLVKEIGNPVSAAAKPTGEMQASSDNTEPEENLQAAEAKIDEKQTPKAETKNADDTQQTSETKEETATVEDSSELQEIEEKAEVLATAVGEAIMTMINTVAETMDLTPEQVEEAMQEIGLEPVDLLTKEGVKDLMIHLSGSDDPAVLISDEQLYAQIQQVTETLSEVQENLTKISGYPTEEEHPVDFGEFLQRLTNSAKPAEKIMPEEQEIPKAPVSKEEPAETPAGRRTADPVRSEAESKTDSFFKPAESISRKENRESGFGKGNELGAGNGGFQTTAYGKAIMEEMTSVQEGTSFVAPETGEVISQLLEKMNATVKPGISELEMQLHPASLGTVTIQIVSREGAVTAQFIAQNEGVKSALESQIVTLKENMEAQGVKVEAVEVTVAQYSMDRNPDENRQQQGEGNTGKRRTIRNIDLSRVEEEELTPEETLEAEVMKSTGSTVSYSA